MNHVSSAFSFWRSAARLGWRTLWRDVRAGELRLLVVAVTLAVAAVSAVGFFATRLQAGLQRDAAEMLGGDLVLVTDKPAPQPLLDQAQRLGLEVVTTVTFPTMARAPQALGGAARLVALKAVAPGYPLRGTLRLARERDGSGADNDVPTRDLPQPGDVWLDSATLDVLQLQLGDTLLLGERSFHIAAILAQEPDRGAGFLNFAPRVMVRDSDVAATGLVQPASRLTYRAAMVGTPQAIAQYAKWVDAQLQPGAGQPVLRGVHLETLESGRPEMSETLARAAKFLRLVALLEALLSAIAVALAARAFAASHLDDCAMLRVLGLGQRTIAGAYGLEFVLAGLFASVLGLALGFGVHFLFLQLMNGLVTVHLPAPGWWPVGLGLGVGLTLLLAFGLPPVLQLAQVPALRVIRRDVGQLRPTSVAVLLLGLAGFAALLLVVSNDGKLGLVTVGGFAAAALVFAAMAWLSIRLLRRVVNEDRAPRWLVLATRQVTAQPAYAVVQVTALALGLLALLLLVLLRTDLLDSWRQTAPPDAPDRFVVNVMPDQAEAFRGALAGAGVAHFDWYPMVRGRLLAINGRAVSAHDYTAERAQHMVEREFNVSYSAQPPRNNVVVAGAWRAGEADAISVEQGLAELLGMHLGDRLLFDMGGVQVASRITTLRKVDWGSMRANFFAMYPVSQLPQVPVTYLAAFRAPPGHVFDNALVRQFPNVTSVDVSSTLKQLERVLDQVARAVGYLFGFALSTGLVVLVAAVGATREERARSYAIMRAVGAQGRLLRQVQSAELVGIGVLAGALAAVLASAMGWALAYFVFGFAWHGSLTPLLLGASGGALLALLAGWWTLRGVLQRPVMASLRRAA